MEDIRLAAIQSTLALEREVATTLRADRAAMAETLRICAAQFREYQRHHAAKGNDAKAERNATLAARAEAHLTTHSPGD